jgi:hypothetical protein
LIFDPDEHFLRRACAMAAGTNSHFNFAASSRSGLSLDPLLYAGCIHTR